MGITAIDHLNVLADDVDQTLDFYRRLGLEVLHEGGIAGGKGRPVLRINGVQKINVIPRRGSSPPALGQHFCMVWDGSMGELTELLASRGITPESPPSTRACARGLATTVYLRDPGGTSIELAVYEEEPARGGKSHL